MSPNATASGPVPLYRVARSRVTAQVAGAGAVGVVAGSGPGAAWAAAGPMSSPAASSNPRTGRPSRRPVGRLKGNIALLQMGVVGVVIKDTIPAVEAVCARAKSNGRSVL